MKMSDSIKNLAAAMAKMQGALDSAKKTESNPFFKSTYADLTSVVTTLKPVLATNGLSYTQGICSNEHGHVGCVTVIMHESGEWLEHEPFYLPLAKMDPQGGGSAATYSRRYSLSAAFGVTADDDDGNSASQGSRPPQGQTSQQRPPTATQQPFREAIVDTETGEVMDISATAQAQLKKQLNDALKAVGLNKISDLKQAVEQVTGPDSFTPTSWPEMVKRCMDKETITQIVARAADLRRASA